MMMKTRQSRKMNKIRLFVTIFLTLLLILVSMNMAVLVDAHETEDELLVEQIYLKSKDVAADGKYHYVGESFESKYKTISITEKGKTFELFGYYTTNKSSKEYETGDSGSPLGTVSLKWKSSDNSIATISPDGLLKPVSDGEAVIAATVDDKTKYKGEAPFKEVKVSVSGQTGMYVTKVRIIDTDGNSLSNKDDALTVIDGANEFFQFHALVTWYDPKTDSTVVEDTRKSESISSTVTWSVGGSVAAGYINEKTGNFKSSESSANCYVQCVVEGGSNGKSVTDTANVQVDTGKYEYDPAGSLTLRVAYQEYPDKAVQEHTYSLSELSSRLVSHTYNYTVIGKSSYGTIRANGYLFKDVVGLENVAMDDIYQFRFNTGDGYDNPITAQLLYGSGSRYYFPNWDIGSKAGASVAPPILATESNLIWGQSEVSPETAMDSGTRFRLVFGPLWSMESNSAHQIYYIRGITIVLKGAPPAGDGKGTSNGSGGDDAAGKGSGAGSGGEGSGSGNSDSGGDGDSYGNSGEKGSIGGSESAGNSNDADNKAGSPNDSGSDKASGTYRVYEMMSNSKSNVASLDADIPYLPAAIPVALGGLMAGSAASYVSFRRRIL